MGRLKYQDCVAKAFEPLLRAAHRDDLTQKLKVIPPPETQRSEQFAKFGAMKAGGSPPLFLPNGGFIFSFFLNDVQCFAFSSFLDEIDLSLALESWLQSNEGVLEFVDQSTFLFLSYYASNYYSLRPEFQSRRAADEIVGLAEFDNYQGHDVDDIISYFRPTYIVSVPADSMLAGIDPYVAATELLALIPGLRSSIIDDEFASRVHNLLNVPSVRAENLFLSLTATRWRYAYLEIFRVIEATLHVPWLLDLTQAAPINLRLPEIYVALRKKLEWREVKGRSIERVFEELNDNDLKKIEDTDLTLIKIKGADNSSRASIGKQIYKIRNQLVHPEDFTDGSKLEVSEDEFRSLAMYLCVVAAKLYEKYDYHLRSKV